MPTTLEVRDNERTLRLRLQRLADRYAHHLDVAAGNTWTTILSSIEGEVTESWPASPPLCDVFASAPAERHATATAALLGTGAAGKTYWSAAITPHVCSLDFDYACRLTQPQADFIGCTYCVSVPVLSSQETSLVLRTALGNVTLSIHNADREHGVLRLTDDKLVISPWLTTNKTQCWKYQIELSR